MATAHAASPQGKELQEGIYPESPTPSSYRLLLLNVKRGTGIGEARVAIARIWTMLRTLCHLNLATDVADAPQRKDPERSKRCTAPELTCLLGFGASLFDRYPRMPRPAGLARLASDGPFPKIRWVAEADRQVGEADLALQFIAWTELAVNRAVAEVWMMIADEFLPLKIVALHGGFNREDKRSWIGFHDGINNVEPKERRREVITAMSTEPAWMERGTYMAFFRLAIDLERWRRLPRRTQELLVGRDKLTGAPLGLELPSPRTGCPVSPLINPLPPSLDSVLRASHMHRANQNRDSHPDAFIPGTPIPEEDNRIFRQGFEFLEQLPGGLLRLGVNFVSFQGRLSRVNTILSRETWLGDVNFGGPPFVVPAAPTDAPKPIVFVEMIAGGYYAVPPKSEHDPKFFPGVSIFS
jgi:deferrochelatase/peroxidase EfeB